MARDLKRTNNGLLYVETKGTRNYKTLRQIAREKGREGVYTTDTFNIEKDLATELNLKERFRNIGYTSEVIGYTEYPNLAEKKEKKLEQKIELYNPTKSKQNCRNKWVKRIGGVLAVAGISYLVSELNKEKNKTPKKENDLPEPPADIGVGGGRNDEGSIGGSRDGGSVGGSRSDGNVGGGR